MRIRAARAASGCRLYGPTRRPRLRSWAQRHTAGRATVGRCSGRIFPCPCCAPPPSRLEEEQLGSRSLSPWPRWTWFPPATAASTSSWLTASGTWRGRRPNGVRRALVEAARVARPGAGLFVFTFSRNTLPPRPVPFPGERFVFTSSRPAAVLPTAEDLVAELRAVGFVPDPAVPLTEHNRRPPGRFMRVGPGDLRGCVPAGYALSRRFNPALRPAPAASRAASASARGRRARAARRRACGRSCPGSLAPGRRRSGARAPPRAPGRARRTATCALPAPGPRRTRRA